MKKLLSLELSILFLIVTCVSISCSSSSDPEPEEIAEVPTGIGNVNDGSQEELIYASKRLYESGIYSVSKENLEALKNNYPEGPYVEFAEIKLADASFEVRDYEESAIMYEDFIKNHPVSPSIPYAILRAGRSHQLSSRGVGRDSEPMAKASEHYTNLVTNYPDSAYVGAATKYREKALSDLAKSEKLIMEYYKNQGKDAAYEARKTEFEEKWANLVRKDEDLETTTIEAKSAPDGQLAKHESNEQILTSNDLLAKQQNSNSKYVSDSYAHGLENFPNIQQVKCLTEGKQRASIFFTNSLDYEFESQLKDLEPVDGVITLKLPARSSRPISIDCLANNDLKIGTDGKLQLKYDSSVSTMVLKHPDRLLILFN